MVIFYQVYYFNYIFKLLHYCKLYSLILLKYSNKKNNFKNNYICTFISGKIQTCSLMKKSAKILLLKVNFFKHLCSINKFNIKSLFSFFPFLSLTFYAGFCNQYNFVFSTMLLIISFKMKSYIFRMCFYFLLCSSVLKKLLMKRKSCPRRNV